MSCGQKFRFYRVYMKDLKQLRNQIDIIDDKIIDLFAQKFSTVKEIGEYKKKHNRSSLDSIRRENLLQSHVNEGKKK